MSVFEQQQRARRKARLYMVLFILVAVAVVLATALAVSLTIYGLYTLFYFPFARISPTFIEWLSTLPQPVVGSSVIITAVVLAESITQTIVLRAGAALPRALGGTLVDSSTRDPARRELLNVIDEMSIAAGIPVPQVFVLEEETGVNSFASGMTLGDCAITVSRGLLVHLSRDEIQAVIGHELSHIINGDTRLNTRLIGMLRGIMIFGVAADRLLGTEPSERVGNSWFVPALALWVVGYFGYLSGRLLQAAVARSRERLADAAALRFTRNPQALAGALKKIMRLAQAARLRAPLAGTIRHMLFADGSTGLFATHPSLTERIRAVDPSFDPATDLGGAAPPLADRAARPSSPPLDPAYVVARVADPAADGLEAARMLLATIPPALLSAARSSQASSVALALALSRDAAERGRQLGRIRTRLPETLYPRLEEIAALVLPLPPTYRLPLLEIAIPALRQLAYPAIERLLAVVDEIRRMDGSFDVLDYALTRLLRVRLRPRAARRTPLTLDAAREDIALVFALAAQVSRQQRAAADGAYAAGIGRLFDAVPPPYRVVPAPWVAELDRALERIDRLAPVYKRAVVEALALTVCHDRQITLGEIDLVRAVCASIHWPMAPLLPPGDEPTARGYFPARADSA